jgi:hypothetical protein
MSIDKPKPNNSIEVKRYAVAAQLNEEERSMLDNMVTFERSKVKGILNEEAAIKAVTDASFHQKLDKERI